MSCREIENMLSAYIDGELRDNDAEFIRLHIDGCNNCSKKMHELKKLSSFTSSLIDDDPPAFLMDKILAKTVYKQSFAEKMIAALRNNRIPSFAGAASVLVLITAAIWIYNPSVSDKQVSVAGISPDIAQSGAAVSGTANKLSDIAASAANTHNITQIAKKTLNIHENRVNHKQYENHIRKIDLSSKIKIASSKDNKTIKKADLKIASSIDDKNSIDAANIHKLNTSNVIPVDSSVLVSDVKKDDMTKTDVTASEKPVEQGFRTALILTTERDNRLKEETDALKEMREKLRSRNNNRKYTNYHVQDMDDRTITVQIASMRF